VGGLQVAKRKGEFSIAPLSQLLKVDGAPRWSASLPTPIPIKRMDETPLTALKLD
jgi:hypothetical protein